MLALLTIGSPDTRLLGLCLGAFRPALPKAGRVIGELANEARQRGVAAGSFYQQRAQSFRTASHDQTPHHSRRVHRDAGAVTNDDKIDLRNWIKTNPASEDWRIALMLGCHRATVRKYRKALSNVMDRKGSLP